eukprot:scaffold10722_cov70-Skeletonema_marinoi.AAC.1
MMHMTSLSSKKHDALYVNANANMQRVLLQKARPRLEKRRPSSRGTGLALGRVEFIFSMHWMCS